MNQFKVKRVYPDGTSEFDDDIFTSSQDAEWHAQVGMEGLAEGEEILKLRGENYVEAHKTKVYIYEYDENNHCVDHYRYY